MQRPTNALQGGNRFYPDTHILLCKRRHPLPPSICYKSHLYAAYATVSSNALVGLTFPVCGHNDPVGDTIRNTHYDFLCRVLLGLITIGNIDNSQTLCRVWGTLR